MTEQERYEKNKASVISMVKFILMVLIICAGCYFATKIIAILVPFLIGFLLAKTSYAIAGVFVKDDKPGKLPIKTRKRRVALVVYVILLIIITILIIWGISAFIAQCSRLINMISDAASKFDINTFGDDLAKRFSKDGGGFLSDSMIETIKTNLASIFANLADQAPAIISAIFASIWRIIGNIPYGIFVVICVILSGYYFINDAHRVMKFYMKNVPNKSFRHKSLKLLNDLSVTLFRVLGGYLLLLIITFVEALIAFKLAGVDFAVVLAFVTGVIDFLPVLGISATMIPVMIWCAIKGKYTAIIILIVAMAIMTVVRRIIEPPILGKSMKIHPLLMLFGMALGVFIWGAAGFLLGPTVLIIILETLKVFEIDKKFMSFLSRVLANFMKKPEAITEHEGAGSGSADVEKD
ncbi:MAG: AI-2E family transporter [Clostridiales bacterium]|nr:AI-2E family transporter [Clostridiales bacterium]